MVKGLQSSRYKYYSLRKEKYQDDLVEKYQDDLIKINFLSDFVDIQASKSLGHGCHGRFSGITSSTRP
jgi:hypothetical protein